MAAPAILRELPPQPTQVLAHQVSIRPGPWVGALGPALIPAAMQARQQLTRGDLFELAAAARAGAMSPLQLFVAVMMWGYGKVGYGPARTTSMLATDNAEERIARAFWATSGHIDGGLAGYAALASREVARLVRLGPAFATKFLYFAGYDRIHNGVQPLILDSVIGGWIAAQTGLRLSPWRWNPSSYGRYLALMHGWAAELGWTPDEVEHRIFTLAR